MGKGDGGKMRPAKYKYQVHDKGLLILQDGTPEQVETITGLNRASISKYLNGKVYKGRFVISVIEIKREPKPKKPVYIDKVLTAKDEMFIAKFDRSMKYLREHYTKETLSRIKFKAVSP
jgi:hypothetical protein